MTRRKFLALILALIGAGSSEAASAACIPASKTIINSTLYSDNAGSTAIFPLGDGRNYQVGQLTLDWYMSYIKTAPTLKRGHGKVNFTVRVSSQDRAGNWTFRGDIPVQLETDVTSTSGNRVATGTVSLSLPNVTDKVWRLVSINYGETLTNKVVVAEHARTTRIQFDYCADPDVSSPLVTGPVPPLPAASAACLALLDAASVSGVTMSSWIYQYQPNFDHPAYAIDSNPATGVALLPPTMVQMPGTGPAVLQYTFGSVRSASWLRMTFRMTKVRPTAQPMVLVYDMQSRNSDGTWTTRSSATHSIAAAATASLQFTDLIALPLPISTSAWRILASQVGVAGSYNFEGGNSILAIEADIFECKLPTPSPTQTPSATATGSPTTTPSITPSRTRTLTSTSTPSMTPTRTHTSTATSTGSATPTRTRTSTLSPTFSDSPTATPTPTFTATFSGSATRTRTPTSSATASTTATATATPSATSSRTATATPSSSASSSATPTATLSRSPSASPSPSSTATPSGTAASTATATSSATASPTLASTPLNSCCQYTLTQHGIVAPEVKALPASDGSLWLVSALGGMVWHWNNGVPTAAFLLNGTVRPLDAALQESRGRLLLADPLHGLTWVGTGGVTQGVIDPAPATAVALDGLRQRIYAVLNSGELRTYDAGSDAEILPRRTVGFGNALAVAPDGKVFIANGIGLLRVDPGNGAQLRFAADPTDALAYEGQSDALAMRGDGVLIVGDRSGRARLFSADGHYLCDLISQGQNWSGFGIVTSVALQGSNTWVISNRAENFVCDAAFSPTQTWTSTPVITFSVTPTFSITPTPSQSPTFSVSPTVTPTPSSSATATLSPVVTLSCQECQVNGTFYAMGGNLNPLSFGPLVPVLGPMAWIQSASPTAAVVNLPSSFPAPFPMGAFSGFRFGHWINVDASGDPDYTTFETYYGAYDGGQGAAEPGDRVLLDWARDQRRVRIEVLAAPLDQLRVSYSTANGWKQAVLPVAVVRQPYSDRVPSQAVPVNQLPYLRLNLRDCGLGFTFTPANPPGEPTLRYNDFTADPSLPHLRQFTLGAALDGSAAFDGVIGLTQIRNCGAALPRSFTDTPTITVSPTITPTFSVSQTLTPDSCAPCNVGLGQYNFDAGSLAPVAGSGLAPAAWVGASPPFFVGTGSARALSGFLTGDNRLDLAPLGLADQEQTLSFAFNVAVQAASSEMVLFERRGGGRWVRVSVFGPGHPSHGKVKVAYSTPAGPSTPWFSAANAYSYGSSSQRGGSGDLLTQPGSSFLALSLRDCSLRVIVQSLANPAQQIFVAPDYGDDGGSGSFETAGNASAGGAAFDGAIDLLSFAACGAPPSLTASPSHTLTVTPSATLTPTSSSTATETPQDTATATLTSSATLTATESSSATASETAADTATLSPTATPTGTPPDSATLTATASASPTATRSPGLPCSLAVVQTLTLPAAPAIQAALGTQTGDFYIAPSFMRAFHYAADGSLLGDLPLNPAAPTANTFYRVLAVDTDGSLLLAGDGQAWRSTAGALQTLSGFGALSQVQRSAVSGQGDWNFVSIQGQVSHYSRGGSNAWALAWTKAAPADLFNLLDLAAGPDGAVHFMYVNTAQRIQIQSYAADGSDLGAQTVPAGSPRSLAVDSRGRYVTLEPVGAPTVSWKAVVYDPQSLAVLATNTLALTPNDVVIGGTSLRLDAQDRGWIWMPNRNELYRLGACDASVWPTLTASPSPTATPSATPTITPTPTLPCSLDLAQTLPLGGVFSNRAALSANGGDFYVGSGLKSVLHFLPDGSPAGPLALDPANPGSNVFYSGIGVDSDGSLLLAGSSGSYRRTSTQLIPLSGLTVPGSLYFCYYSPQGDWYFASGTDLQRYARIDANTWAFAWAQPYPADLVHPNAAATAPDGSVRLLYRSSSSQMRMAQYDASGSPLATLDLGVSQVHGFTYDRQGRLLTLESSSNGSRVTWDVRLRDPQSLALLAVKTTLPIGDPAGISADAGLAIDTQDRAWAWFDNYSEVYRLSPCDTTLWATPTPDGPASASSLRPGPPKVIPAAVADRLVLAPNPFQQKGRLLAALTQAGPARVSLADISGQPVWSLNLPLASAGEQALDIDLGGLASGIYFAVLEQDRGFGWRSLGTFKLAIAR